MDYGIEEPKKRFNFRDNKNLIIIGLLFVILIGLLIGGYFYFQNKLNEKQKDNPDDVSSSKINDEQNSSKEIETSEYKVEKWNNISYSSPKHFYTNEIGTENYCEYFYSQADVEYHNVATLTTGETVVRTIYGTDMGSAFDTFIIDNNNKITNIGGASCLIPEIKVDNSIIIPEINPKDDITYNNEILIFNYSVVVDQYTYSEELINTKISTSRYGDLFELKEFMNDDVYFLDYYLKTPDTGLIHYYSFKNNSILNNDGTIMASWFNDSYKSISWGEPYSNCETGSYGAGFYLKNFDSSKGIQVGSISNTNKPLYKLTDDKLLKIFYDMYFMEDPEFNSLSFDEYKEKYVAAVYQTPLGNWRILTNSEYSYAGECGKPVIYLYPENDTYINVEVGAEISISDPHYPSGGWKNVFAKTDGSLTYKGKNYESLFWEGLGNGKYPIIGRSGKLVTQDKLIPTIKKDLLDQGLNNKEISDFIDFWKDNLPKSPYVRLTWLNTKEMNALAPLKVYPRPQTMIRVFLDAKGYNTPFELKPQTFTKVERKGFTLVEWGGQLLK